MWGPAEVGVLVALVREKYKDYDMNASHYLKEEGPLRWCVEYDDEARIKPSRAWYGATEVEALLAALKDET